VDAPGGVYDYRTSFFAANTSFTESAFFAADNDATIYLNGVDTGIVTSDGGHGSGHGFEQYTPFTINDHTPGFDLNGQLNILDFMVTNQDGTPTGLTVEVTPEPSSLLLMGSGVLALVGVMRRKLVG
jgi:hypothetical protein